MNNQSVLSEQEIRNIVSAFAAVSYPGKSVDEVLEIARANIDFTIDYAISKRLTEEDVRRDLLLTSLVDNEYHPEEEDEKEDVEPKDDFGFWRTGIRVSPY